jgi:hypothetical protein
MPGRLFRPGRALFSAFVAANCLEPPESPMDPGDVGPFDDARPAPEAPAWSRARPRPDVPRDDAAHLAAAEAKRTRRATRRT